MHWPNAFHWGQPDRRVNLWPLLRLNGTERLAHQLVSCGSGTGSHERMAQWVSRIEWKGTVERSQGVQWATTGYSPLGETKERNIQEQRAGAWERPGQVDSPRIQFFPPMACMFVCPNQSELLHLMTPTAFSIERSKAWTLLGEDWTLLYSVGFKKKNIRLLLHIVQDIHHPCKHTMQVLQVRVRGA